MRFISFGTLLLLACVGDAPVNASSDASTSGADTSPPGDSGGGNPDTSVADATPPCDGGTYARCADGCMDVATAVTDCGACGHDCGGGMCLKGVCQPTVVVDKLDHPVFDVDKTNVYFNPGMIGGTHNADFCPKAGCPLTPTLLSNVGDVYNSQYGGGTMLVMGPNIVFRGEKASYPGRPYLFACDLSAGCGNAPATFEGTVYPESFGSDFFAYGSDVYWTQYKWLRHGSCSAGNTCSAEETLITATLTYNAKIGLSADATGVYFIGPGPSLQSCPKSGACVPTTLLASVPSSFVFNTFAYGSLVYMLDSQISGYAKGSITTCATSGTCATPTPFITGQSYPTLLSVDAQGVYWYNSDTNELLTCPLTGCKPASRSLATAQANVTALHTDDSFVYWATDTQILRVAK